MAVTVVTDPDAQITQVCPVDTLQIGITAALYTLSTFFSLTQDSLGLPCLKLGTLTATRVLVFPGLL